MVVPKFALLYMQIKGLLVHSSEPCQMHFAQPPKVLDAVDVVAPIGKLIFAMLHPKMLFIPIVDQAVVGFKTIGVKHGSGVGFPAYNRHQLLDRAVFNHLRIDLVAALKHAKNRGFSACAASPNAAYAPCAKVAFVELYLAVLKGAFRLAQFGDALPNFVENIVYSVSIYARKLRHFFCLHFEAKKPQNDPKSLFRNLGSKKILITHCSTIN